MNDYRQPPTRPADDCAACSAAHKHRRKRDAAANERGLTPPASIVPETAGEALARWDRGEPVFTVELGGLGPGYEQAIHLLVFETIREHEASVPVGSSVERARDRALARIDEMVGGFSGAQVGAASQYAYLVLRDGWRAVVERHGKDRMIQVSKTWPRAEAGA